MSVARDLLQFRGTGGVLHDVAREFADEDYLIVASGATLPVEPLLLDLVNAGVGVRGMWGY